MKLQNIRYLNSCNVFKQFLLMFLLVLLSGCENYNSNDGNELATKSESGIPVPLAIQSRALPESGALQAYIKVDDEERRVMVVANNQAAVSFSGLTLGEHEFTIHFEFNLPNASVIILATAVRTLDIVDGANFLSYAQDDYTFPDDDGDGISNLDELSNILPVANAGLDQTAVLNSTIVLNGGDSSDENGDALSYKWSFVTIPAGSAANISDPTAVMPTFIVDIADVGADYIVQLIVNDGISDSEPDTVTVSTGNTKPVANAGPDQFAVFEDTVVLNGSDSSDANGDALTYQWSFASVPAGSTASLSDPTVAMPTFTVDVADISVDYVIQLIVNDGTSDSEPDMVTISTGNIAPVANAGPDQSVVFNESVILNGSDSSDANGDGLTYTWSFITVPPGSTASLSDPSAVMPTFTIDINTVGALYIAQLIVNDGVSDSVPDLVVISTGNIAPVANAGPDQSAKFSDTVILDASNSSDANGDTLTYKWSLEVPLGSTASLSDPTALMPTFIVDVTGEGVSYIAQLIANDGRVDSSPDTIIINTSNTKPVANAGTDLTHSPGDTVSLNGTGSSDVDLDALTYSWSLTAVPPGSSAALNNANLSLPSFTADLAGTYVAQLIVNDGIVNSDPDNIVIKVANLVNIFVNFETPILGALEERRVIDPYRATGVSFSVIKSSTGNGIAGIVKNRATSACVDPADANQKFASGVDLGSIGLSGFPIVASFNPVLVSIGTPTKISVEVQTGSGVSARLRLLNSIGQTVATVSQIAGPDGGTCGFPGGQRARFVITATTTSPVASAIVDIPGGGRVFVIDNVQVSAGQP